MPPFLLPRKLKGKKRASFTNWKKERAGITADIIFLSKIEKKKEKGEEKKKRWKPYLLSVGKTKTPLLPLPRTKKGKLIKVILSSLLNPREKGEERGKKASLIFSSIPGYIGRKKKKEKRKKCEEPPPLQKGQPFSPYYLLRRRKGDSPFNSLAGKG